MTRDANDSRVGHSRDIRVRLWWTALLVLIALGGAGLTVAADRPHNPEHRPELTWHADTAAAPWIAALTDELGTLEVMVTNVSAAGRRTLGTLQALDLDALDSALTDGDGAAAEIEAALGDVTGLRDRAAEQIDEWRLSVPVADRLARQTLGVDAASTVPGLWHALAADAREIAAMVDALQRHDGLVFRATTAGRQSEWEAALDFLEQAETRLADVERTRDRLSGVDPTTLDDLLARYRAYDAALTNLYSHIRDTAQQSGSEFERLRDLMEQAQAALPGDTSALSVIVAEAAGPPLSRGLVAIEHAHGEILDATVTDEEFDAPEESETAEETLQP